MFKPPRTVPPTLSLFPEVNLLTEFAVIATSPQSLLVRGIGGENAFARRRDPKVCDQRKREPTLCQLPFSITSSFVRVVCMPDFRFSKVSYNLWLCYQRETELLREMLVKNMF